MPGCVGGDPTSACHDETRGSAEDSDGGKGREGGDGNVDERRATHPRRGWDVEREQVKRRRRKRRTTPHETDLT